MNNKELIKLKIKSLYLPSLIVGIAFGTVFCNDSPNSVLQMIIKLTLIISCAKFIEQTYIQERLNHADGLIDNYCENYKKALNKDKIQ